MTQRHDTTGRRSEVTDLLHVPNVGPRLATVLEGLGIRRPHQLCDRDPYKLYERLCRRRNARVDPCVLDVFIAAVAYMNGGPPKPWWKFTHQRKRRLRQSISGPRATVHRVH